MHVVRQKTAKGWRTSLKFDRMEVPKGAPPVPNEVTGIEIDEDGKQMMSVEGRALIPISSGKMSVGKGPRGMAVTIEDAATRSSGTSDPFDMLDKVMFTKSEAPSRMARAAEKAGSAGEPRWAAGVSPELQAGNC